MVLSIFELPCSVDFHDPNQLQGSLLLVIVHASNPRELLIINWQNLNSVFCTWWGEIYSVTVSCVSSFRKEYSVVSIFFQCWSNVPTFLSMVRTAGGPNQFILIDDCFCPNWCKGSGIEIECTM